MRTVGVEEEFVLLRRDAAQLAGRGDDVAERADELDPGGQFEHELMQPQAELGSEPAQSLAELRADLDRLRAELAAGARAEGARLVASGTSPVAGHPRTTEDERYERMLARFGAVARRELTCGMHVHVAVGSDDEGVRVIDGITPYLSVLTALSANSPFHEGVDTGYASYRTVLWTAWPTSGPTAPFGGAAAYHELRTALIDSGAALDDGMIYFDARLSQRYPTVEVRACDVCTDHGVAVALAGLIRALVDTAADSDLPPAETRPELLRAATWRAARFGMGDRLLDVAGLLGRPAALVPAWELADAVVERAGGSLDRCGDRADVAAGFATLRNQGTGAERQRVARGRGMSALLDLLAVQ